MLPIGRVLRAHGLRGELHVQLFRPRRGKEDGTAKGVVFIGDEKTTLKRARWISADNVVLLVAGITDRDAAEAKKGLLIEIEPNDPKTLPQALVDDADVLIGLQAVDAETSRVLGVVASVEDNGAQPILVIEHEGKETLVPCVDAFIAGSKDGAVLINAIPGLFEDAPEAPSED